MIVHSVLYQRIVDELIIAVKEGVKYILSLLVYVYKSVLKV